MKPSSQKAQTFTALHQKGNPVVLFNIWDAGSAQTIVAEGAQALATGSWSVAAAHGFHDGEKIPFDLLEIVVACIAHTVEVPLSVDFEGGFAVDPTRIEEHATRLIDAGAVGVNFEDQIVGGDGLYARDVQAKRIGAIRKAANRAGVPLFINARTDLFLRQPDRSKHVDSIEAAIERAEAYLHAGASGFFVPGLVDLDLVERVCVATALPVNVFMTADASPIAEFARRGVSRVSFGPYPYRWTMKALASLYREKVGT